MFDLYPDLPSKFNLDISGMVIPQNAPETEADFWKTRGGAVSATNAELKQMATDLYKKMGGVGNKDARIVRALLERWELCQKEIDNLYDTCPDCFDRVPIGFMKNHQCSD